MSRIIKFAKTIRRHWKKSLFGFSAISYGISYGHGKYKTFQLMRAYCEEAKKYGDIPQPRFTKARHVTVILNPAAHGRGSKSLYEKYAAPLLHLAGLRVSIFETENEGQAVDLMEIMGNTDAVIIAGGNGTLKEAVTGLLRRPEYEDNATTNIPIGVIPVGHSNAVARVLFSKNEDTAQWLAEAAMAVIRESTVLLDVMRVDTGEEKPHYALSSVEFGAFRDVEETFSKYWYFGPLKVRAAYFLASLKKRLNIDDITIDYTPACDGCSRCYLEFQRKRNEKLSKRWWSSFLPRSNINMPEKDYSKVINEDCGIWNSEKPSASNLMISTELRHAGCLPSSKAIWTSYHSAEMPMKEFITSGMMYHEGKPIDKLKVDSAIPMKEVVLKPPETEEPKSCYIDTEKHDFQKLHISLLPKHLAVYI